MPPLQRELTTSHKDSEGARGNRCKASTNCKALFESEDDSSPQLQFFLSVSRALFMNNKSAITQQSKHIQWFPHCVPVRITHAFLHNLPFDLRSLPQEPLLLASSHVFQSSHPVLLSRPQSEQTLATGSLSYVSFLVSGTPSSQLYSWKTIYASTPSWSVTLFLCL